MSAHTPGPWHVYNGGDIFSALGSDSGDGVMAADNDGWHIAEIPQTPTTTAYGDEVELGWEVMRANARLIAASPRMYDYIAVRARAGDREAQEIISGVDHAKG